MSFHAASARRSSSGASAGASSVCSISQIAPSMTSRRLCGGMLVAMPTAMPVDPLTSRFGKRRRQDRRLGRWSRRSWARSRRCPCRGPSSIAAATASSRASVYRMAAGGSPSTEPKLPWPSTSGVAHVELLRHADQRVVDRRVAVRVVVAHRLADDLGALAVGAVAGQPHLLHREQDAAMRRLQPVADVGQRAPDDHAHGVIQVRALHLVFDVDGNARFVVMVRRGLGWSQGVAWTRCPAAPAPAPSTPHSDVQVAHVQRVVFDELAARLDLIAHQRREHLVGFGVVLGAHLQQRADRPGSSWFPTAFRGSSRRGPCSD